MAFLRQYRFAPEAARKMLLKAVPEELEDRVLSFLRGKCTKQLTPRADRSSRDQGRSL